MYRDLFFYEYSERPLRRLNDCDIEDNPQDGDPEKRERGSYHIKHIFQERNGNRENHEQETEKYASGKNAIFKEGIGEQGFGETAQ